MATSYPAFRVGPLQSVPMGELRQGCAREGYSIVVSKRVYLSAMLAYPGRVTQTHLKYLREMALKSG